MTLDPARVAAVEAAWEDATGGARIDIVDAFMHGPTALVDLDALDELLAARARLNAGDPPPPGGGPAEVETGQASHSDTGTSAPVSDW